jgi:3-mercaptopyruvate sulfurtransferase SseA/uncharacterized membrane protein YedE/YeeE
MIETFFGRELLDSPQAMFAALVIGLAFGFVLERAGFGSSRKLAGIFYLKDMTVLKVMFTAVITAMLGLSYAFALGWVSLEQVYALPTIYRAQTIGGLLFGVGFVMSGWCPGTSAVGAASGKLDAVVFLLGTLVGAIGFNEAFGLLQTIGAVPSAHEAGVLGEPGDPQVAFGVPRATFAVLFTLLAVGAFHAAEWIERRQAGGGMYLGSPFLKALSLGLVIFAMALFVLPSPAESLATGGGPAPGVPSSHAELLQSIEAAADHMEPEELADRLMRGEPELVVVDVRSPAEFAAFHIRGAIRVALPDLPSALDAYKNRGTIVLYSNGMTHPAQARDALAQLGYRNAYLLTDGLQGFAERCLKPASLRNELLPDAEATRVRAWRTFFLAAAPAPPAAAGPNQPQPAADRVAVGERLPGLVETDWLAERLGKPGVRIIDVRPQPEYNTNHIPGAVCVNPESFRGVVGGVSSMLLPADVLARHLSLMGIRPADTIVVAPGNAVRDATLVGLGLERLGHRDWAILSGGFAKWSAEQRPVDTVLPSAPSSDYPVPPSADAFTVGYSAVLGRVGDKRTVILDTRPADFFRGAKSDEARAGHIPGAVNRPFKEDLDKNDQLKPPADLAHAYAALIPAKETTVIVHCRTGHQASQTFFVLTRLLGYKNVQWYDASWTEWSARPELPVEK